MATYWKPDFCPPGDLCNIEIEPDFSAVRQFVHCCPYHASLNLTEQELFAFILRTGRKKETARNDAKLALGLDDAPSYKVLENGDINILTVDKEVYSIVRAE